MSTNIFGWEQDSDGIVVLTIDDPDHGANTMNDAFRTSFDETLDRLEKEVDSITGVVLTSGKKSFFGGGNLNSIMAIGPDEAEKIMGQTGHMKGQLQ